jgi:hypothetical protein
MQNVMRKTEMLNKALEILPATEEDIFLTGSCVFPNPKPKNL